MPSLPPLVRFLKTRPLKRAIDAKRRQKALCQQSATNAKCQPEATADHGGGSTEIISECEPVATIIPPVVAKAPPKTTNHVYASSFADPADIRAFRKAKAAGKSDQEAFKVGDNGIGKWGDDTTANRPMCALPPDDWKQIAYPPGAKVMVYAKETDRTVIAELRDTMPAKANIKNGCGIDLNPAACHALGLEPPIRTKVWWAWAEDVV